jgi:Rod binding domain-containing protein
MGPGMMVNRSARTVWEQDASAPAVVSSSLSSNPTMRKLQNAAREFEGILLANLWQAWNKSDQLGDENDPIGDSMTGMGIEMASMAMAEKGGVGIARMIVNSLKGEVNGRLGK